MSATTHTHTHEDGHSHDHTHTHEAGHSHNHTHTHEAGHSHGHGHGHGHGHTCNHDHEEDDGDVELDETYDQLDGDDEPDSSERDIFKMLNSYENPEGVDATKKLDPSNINKLLEQLKHMKPSERMNMMNLFTNMAKNNKTFGDHSFRTVSNDSRESNRDRLKKLLKQKTSARKSRTAIESLKDKAQDALYQLNSKNKDNQDNTNVSDANVHNKVEGGVTATKKRNRKKKVKRVNNQQVNNGQSDDVSNDANMATN